jgi:putative endonuclease
MSNRHPPGAPRSSGRRLPPHLLAGCAAEDAACAFLHQHGLRILARNFRVRGGEIDIIAGEGSALVFVEVRWRASRSHGGALASIDWRKRIRLERAAACYLQGLRRLPPCRFDALCCDADDPIGWRWIRGL